MTVRPQDVGIDRRFARSARIDADLNGTPPLIGYVLQASVEKSLTTLAASQIDSRQGAFTWTGPYGGGKSSAALLVANLVAGSAANRKIASRLAGKPLATLYARAFPAAQGQWDVVAVTGSRVRLRDAVIDAAAQALSWSAAELAAARASDDALIAALLAAAGSGRGGLLLILDELGKMLEHEALEGGDVHLLQDLAEHASRSDGRLVVVGILHQSFDQYAARASRDSRQEWAKVQGRYQDIAFLTGADETVALLGRAITCAVTPESARDHAVAVANAVALRRPTEVDSLAQALAETWPLNPMTALLLGPVSRQRFAQNERSLFGFLSSAEPAGFQDFLANDWDGQESYGPARLWDYLATNFGMALASGGDGGRFSLAFEAIERAEAKGGALHVELTKAAAVVEFFRNGSGLALADDFLAEAVPTAKPAAVAAAIADLLDWAVLIRQPRLGGYALFAGSDFDLEDAISRTMAPVDDEQLGTIAHRVGFGFATAKRHYFKTGALRTFDINLRMVGDLDAAADVAARIASAKSHGSGQLVLLLSDGSLDARGLKGLAKAAAKRLHAGEFVAAIGSVTDSYRLRETASELAAVERIIRDHPQLEGDRIARREIAARQSRCVDELHRSIDQALDTASWWLAPDPGETVSAPLAIVASQLADRGFPASPIIKSELLQRDKPSSNAVAALRELCYAMVARPGDAELGMSGYPAERGLYLTLVQPFGLHAEVAPGRFDFGDPDDGEQGRSLRPAWDVVAGEQAFAVADVYGLWSRSPYGIKAGVMPVLMLSFLMANRDRMAVYLDGAFQTAFDDVFVDKLLQKPETITVKLIDRSVRETAFLSGLAGQFGIGQESASLPVAQALFQRFEQLPPFAARTHRLKDDAVRVRDIVLSSNDPEALLFAGLPEAFDDRLSPELVYGALSDCEAAYPGLLAELRIALARSLGVEAADFAGIAERAETISGLTNDFNFDAFAMRAAAFDGGDGDIEGLVSLLLHKPAQTWSDRDREQALSEMARYGRRFRELEALASVRDRRTKSEALALVVGLDPLTPPVMRSFVLTDAEKRAASTLADMVLETLGGPGGDSQLQLAALARAVASIAADAEFEAEAA
jgi:hypothetical protein